MYTCLESGKDTAVMARLPEDIPLEEIEQQIREGEARQAEQLLVLETQEWPNQFPNAARESLEAINEALSALRCRRSYLQAMQEKP
jgi:hypothetical protein